jgi:hypothetical protein
MHNSNRLIMIIVFSLLIFSINFNNALSVKGNLVYSKEGIRVSYPSYWDLREYSFFDKLAAGFSSVASFYAPGEGNGYEVASIDIDKYNYQDSLKKYLNDEKEFLAEYDDYELFDIKYIQVADRPAYELTYFADSLYHREIIIIAGEHIYTLDYQGPKKEYDKYYDDGNRIINSLKISEPDISHPNALTLEKGCMEVGTLIQKTNEQCTSMFNGNDIKSKGAWYIGCHIAKLIGGRLHPIATVVAFFIPC